MNKWAIIISVIYFGLPSKLAHPEESTPVSFRAQIAPILLDNCLACHGAKKAEGGYRVDTYQEMIKPGDSGVLPISTTDDQTSELLRRLICEDESERMPAESEPLRPEQIEFVKRWIAEGGKYDGEVVSQPLMFVIPPAQYADPPAVYAQSIPISATSFSPDGKQIITSGYHELVVWNVEDAKMVRRIKNVGQRVFALAFSSDGLQLAVGCGEPGKSGEVRLLDFASGEVRGVIARSQDVVLDLAYRPGSKELAVASADSSIRIINLETMQEVRTIASHADWVTAIAWSDDGSRLASASRDKSAKVYDGSTSELIASYLGHGSAVRGISVLADNLQVVSVGADNRLHRWNVEGAAKVAEVALGGEGQEIIRNGTNLFIPCSNQRLLQIDLGGNTIAREFSGHQDWVLSASFRPDKGMLASGSFDGDLRLWNTADGALIRNWNAKP